MWNASPGIARDENCLGERFILDHFMEYLYDQCLMSTMNFDAFSRLFRFKNWYSTGSLEKGFEERKIPCIEGHIQF